MSDRKWRIMQAVIGVLVIAAVALPTLAQDREHRQQVARDAQAKAVQAVKAKQQAAKAAKVVANKLRRGEKMDSYVVSGAGDTLYNGEYVPYGTYGGKTLYRKDDGHWLSWTAPMMMVYRWCLGTVAGAGDGYWGTAGADLPATPWIVSTGTAPAPTVTLAASPPAPSPSGATSFRVVPNCKPAQVTIGAKDYMAWCGTRWVTGARWDGSHWDNIVLYCKEDDAWIGLQLNHQATMPIVPGGATSAPSVVLSVGDGVNIWVVSRYGDQVVGEEYALDLDAETVALTGDLMSWAVPDACDSSYTSNLTLDAANTAWWMVSRVLDGVTDYDLYSWALSGTSPAKVHTWAKTALDPWFLLAAEDGHDWFHYSGTPGEFWTYRNYPYSPVGGFIYLIPFKVTAAGAITKQTEIITYTAGVLTSALWSWVYSAVRDMIYGAQCYASRTMFGDRQFRWRPGAGNGHGMPTTMMGTGYAADCITFATHWLFDAAADVVGAGLNYNSDSSDNIASDSAGALLPVVFDYPQGCSVTNLRATGGLNQYRADWNFVDIDGFAQAAFRIKLLDGTGATSRDTGWVSSANAYYSETGISSGVYTLQLYVRDTDGNESSVVQTTVSITGARTGDPPQPRIVSPLNAATVSGATVAVSLSATDDHGLSTVTLEADGAVVATWSPGGVGVRDWTGSYSWDSTALADRTAVLRMTAQDSDGNSVACSVTVTVHNSAGPTNSSPTVGFSSPANGATVQNVVGVVVWAMDDTGLVSAGVNIPGHTNARESISGTRWAKTYTWDTRSVPNGTYYLGADAVDEDNNGTPASILVVVQNAAVTNDKPPVIVIQAPAADPTVEGDVAVRLSVTDDFGLSTIILAVDGAVVQSWSPGGFGTRSYSATYTWGTTYFANGRHALTVTAIDSAGQASSVTQYATVSNPGGGGGGGEVPTVEITAPLDAGVVSDTQVVVVEATDDAGLASVTLSVDGGPALSVSEGGVGDLAATESFSWDTLNYGNGEHVLLATATDSDGNTATDTITVTVNNASASTPKLFVSERFSLIPAHASPLAAQLAEMISKGRQISKVLLAAVVSPSAVPENAYGLRFGICSGGEWAGFDACQTLIPGKTMSLQVPCQDARVAIEFTPLVTWQNWAMTPANAIDYQVLDESTLLIMVPGPPVRIFKWGGVGSVETWLDLTGTWAENYNGVGFRVVGDKCYIIASTDDATPQPAVLVQDLSSNTPTSNVPYAVEFGTRSPHVLTDIEFLGTDVFVGTDNGAGAGTVWRLTDNDAVLTTSAIPGVRCIWKDGNTLYAGGADGNVYTGTTIEYATGEDHLNAGGVAGASNFALTGDGGAIFRKRGNTWAPFATAAMTEPACLAYFSGRLWLGGNSGALYCYDFATSVWQLYTTLAGWTAITQLVAFGGQLLVFGNGGGNLFKSLAIVTSHITGRCVNEFAMAIVDTSEVTS